MSGYTSWIYNTDNSSYQGHYPFEQKQEVSPGYYKLSEDYYSSAPILTKVPLKGDKRCLFSKGPLNLILSEIEKFWKCNSKYLDLGMTHKRSLMLYGPPGCGKTGIIQSVIDSVIQQNGVAFQLNNIAVFMNVIAKFREIQPHTPIVAIAEDIEDQLRSNEVQFLELFDGSSSIGGNVLYLSTTNNLERIPERIRCRPSRVDTLIEVSKPSAEHRLEYVKFVIGHLVSDSLIDEIVEQTNDFSLADLKEIIVSTYIYEKTITEAVERVRSAKNPLVDVKKTDDDDDDDDE